MKKSLSSVAAIALTFSGAGLASAMPPGDVPTSGEFAQIYKYYNAGYQLVGYDIDYCDGSTDSYREPGENLIYIEIEEGTCVQQLPF